MTWIKDAGCAAQESATSCRYNATPVNAFNYSPAGTLTKTLLLHWKPHQSLGYTAGVNWKHSNRCSHSKHQIRRNELCFLFLRLSPLFISMSIYHIDPGDERDAGLQDPSSSSFMTPDMIYSLWGRLREEIAPKRRRRLDRESQISSSCEQRVIYSHNQNWQIATLLNLEQECVRVHGDKTGDLVLLSFEESEYSGSHFSNILFKSPSFWVISCLH